jgi:uncharacterized protein YycO
MSNIDGLHRFIDVRNENNTNVNNHQKSNNQPIANVDRANSRVGLQFLFGIFKKFNKH